MSGHKTLKERVGRELLAHTEDDVLAESYRLKNRFPHIWTYPSRRRLFAGRDSFLDDLTEKRVLDYGCGRGESSLGYLSKGAIVSGIDISPTYVETARSAAASAGFSSDRYEFHVMDAHAMQFHDNTFDFVVGEGILHHLNASVALREIWRVLKPGGRVLLQEPLADNPLLKLFRLLTPKARTADEAPFTGKQVRCLTDSRTWRSETTYCGILEAPVAIATSILMRSRPNNALLRLTDRIERWTHDHRILLRWNQYVLFNLVKI